MLRLRSATVHFLLLAALPTAAAAQSTLVGRVVDAETGAAVGGAEVRLFGESGSAVGTTLGSDEGTFRLDVPAEGFYSLEVRRVGYAFVRADSLPLGAADSTQVEVRLGIEAVPLDPVVVVAPEYYEPMWLTRFRERAEANQRGGIGRIYTREDIDRLRPMRAEHLLATYHWRRGCQPEILVDGLPADASLSMLRGDDLEGVEIYRGFGQIPPEYYRAGMCGLVMFWRRVDGPGMRPLTWRRVATAGAVLLILGGSAFIF